MTDTPTPADWAVLNDTIQVLDRWAPRAQELADFVDACNNKMLRGERLSEVELELLEEHHVAVRRCREALDLYNSWMDA